MLNGEWKNGTDGVLRFYDEHGRQCVGMHPQQYNGRERWQWTAFSVSGVAYCVNGSAPDLERAKSDALEAASELMD